MRDTDLPIRASVLDGLSALVTELGGSGDDFLAAYGVDALTPTSRDAFISLRLVERILDDAAHQLDAFDVGLRMAAQQDLNILGPLAIAMENSPTVGDALECANRFLFVLSPALSHAVVPDPLGNPGVLGVRFANSLGDGWPQGIDYGLGVTHRAVALVAGGVPYGLRSVQLPHARLAPESVYRDHFGAEVAFDCPDAVLRVPRQIMDLPVQGGNHLLLDIAMDFLESHFSDRAVPVSELVSVILTAQLGPEQPDLAKAARLLDLHPRSLQRLLTSEGVGFKDLVDRARRQHALDLITTTRLSFSQIAALVGMREQSSLTRAARRWFGMSPSQLRSSGRGPMTPAGSTDPISAEFGAWSARPEA
ncbi:AraC family transcriptional regulator ligand-binding domain-containing protein [Marmoricola sp. URHA0025 HA25]